MAAVVVAHRRHSEEDEEGDNIDREILERLTEEGMCSTLQPKKTADWASELDGDGDGRVDKKEMLVALKYVSIRADHLYLRLKTEKDIAVMICKLPVFFLCLGAFLTGLLEFAPPASTADIHRHIRSHFEAEAIEEIKDFEGVYEYMQTFARRNAEFQATSTKYWCEKRYWKYIWDADLGVPRRTCASPRQYALTLSEDPDWNWVNLHESGGAAAGGSSHRRMASSASYADPDAPCADNDTALQAALPDHPGVTCAGYDHVCEIELGIALCPVKCGYCPPWEYQMFHKFGKTQVTMLPVMIYQTRFGAAECHGFAHIYEEQPYNKNLWQMPPLDGPRDGPLLYCMDRTQHLEDTYAMELECPANAPLDECPPGETFHVTHKDSFHGITIYPKLLAEPKHNIDQLQALEWLDVQTETVTLSTMVYTEGLEVFTSVAVEFSVSEAGNLDASFSVVSYKDLINGVKTKFIVSMIITSAGALIGVLVSARNLCMDWSQCRIGFEMYEMVSRGILMAFPIYLLVSWSMQKPMSVEYDELLHTFLDMKGGSKEDWESMIHHFFEVKTHIYGETTWMKAQRVAAYKVLYFQFLQLILYMSAHPKMGVLTDTIARAAVHLLHFLILFGTLFVMLGFMAHWMLGEQIQDFATFSDTMRSQVQMLFGEFIYIDGADKLSDSYTIMYWVYASTFGIVVFFTLLNFFLAIIVDAFVDVKESTHQHVILGDVFTDLKRVFFLSIKWRRKGWPARNLFISHFRKLIKEKLEGGSFVSKLQSEDDEAFSENLKVTCLPEDLVKAIDGLTKEQLADILHYYFSFSTAILCQRSERRLSQMSGELGKQPAKEPVKDPPSAPSSAKGDASILREPPQEQTEASSQPLKKSKSSRWANFSNACNKSGNSEEHSNTSI